MKLTSVGNNSAIIVHGITKTPNELKQTYASTQINKT